MQNTTDNSFGRSTFVLFWTVVISVVLISVMMFINLYVPRHWTFESKAELEKIRTELPLAEARWKSHNITDYDIDVQVFIHLGLCSTELNGKPTTLSVRQGKLVITDEVRNDSLEEGCTI